MPEPLQPLQPLRPHQPLQPLRPHQSLQPLRPLHPLQNLHTEAQHNLQGLNEAQKTAVISPESVVQILAPPGSGKTKTLTSRVAYLLQQHGYRPQDIVCLTFTIKSAREMKERIANMLAPEVASQLVLGTFHSVCRRYLAAYGHLIKLSKRFGIADSSDSQAIISRICKRLKVQIDPRVARSRISSSKSRNIGFTKVNGKRVDQQEVAQVFEAYEAHLASSNLLDYDDLLLRCADLLRQYPECVSNVEMVLIDEFQDTNVVQFELMTLFACQNRRITTVGDPDQSIYGWRSADVRNLGRMQETYADALVINLEHNYRSAGAILQAASQIIRQDESRPPKALLPTHCHSTLPVLRTLASAAAEAAWLVSEVARCIALNGSLFSHSDFAILLRSAALSRHVESAMGKVGMPYRMVGGARFFDRVEIKILLDYLRVIYQPENTDALARIINVPARRVGTTTIKLLLEEAATRQTPLWSLVRGDMTRRTKLAPAAERGLASFANLLIRSRKRLFDAQKPSLPCQLLEEVVEQLEFKRHLERSYPEDHAGRWANVEELMVQASNGEAEDWSEEALPTINEVAQEERNGAVDALARFLANVALSTEIQRQDEADQPHGRVTISTIHAAKGLEWPVVFIPAVYDGSLPHSRAEDVDEERRLLYVAMTRAQALLYLSWPKHNSNGADATLSPFLPEACMALFADRGPMFEFEVVYDMARILRRPAPCEDELLAGLSAVPSMHDDLWPVDGTPEADPNEAAPFGGFVSAGHVQVSEAWSKREAKQMRGEERQKRNEGKRNLDDDPNLPSKRIKGQKTLTSLWTFTSRQASKETCGETSTTIANEMAREIRKDDSKKMTDNMTDKTAATNATASAQDRSPGLLAKQNASSRVLQPLDPMPQQRARLFVPPLLATHTLPVTASHRPQHKAQDNLLSSPGEPQEPRQQDKPLLGSIPCLTQSLDLEPAKRRTLGLRRSMIGWPGQPGFRPPLRQS